eukprot:UN01093
MAIPPRNRLLIVNIDILYLQKDAISKNFTKILSRKTSFSKKLKNLNQSTKNSKLNFRYIHVIKQNLKRH